MSVEISLNQIQFSIDLVDKALNQLEFLEAVDKLKPILRGEILKKSVYRYEKLWLKFLIKHPNLIPPLDVLWIWHCHMLNPIQYFNDMMSLFDRLLDHTNLSMKEIINGQENTKLIWQSELNCSYDFLDLNSVDDQYQNYKTSLKYDLYEASSRQFEFYYQVSLPHYKSQQYLQLALDRYKKFLYLKKKHPLLFIVPCYSIDLIWHTHQLNPHAYSIDTIELIGGILEHDDSVVDRSAGEKLDVSSRETMELWKELYNEKFFLSGSTFRGVRPTDEFYSDFEYKSEYRLANFKLKEISMKSKNQENITLKITIHEGNTNESSALFDHLIKEDEKEKKENDLLNLYVTKSEEYILRTELVDKFGSKIVNLVKSGHRHNTSYDNKFNFTLDFQNETNREQCLTFDLDGPKNDEIKLNLKWNLSIIKNRPTEIEFLIHKNDFIRVNMNQIKSNYRNFFAESFNFGNGEALKAEHKIIPTLYHESNRKINFELEAYTAEILHLISMQWSSIRILKGNKLLASSKLINLQQLPTYELKLDNNCISLNPSFEKAMIVSNLNGDYALIKGQWKYNKLGES